MENTLLLALESVDFKVVMEFYENKNGRLLFFFTR